MLRSVLQPLPQPHRVVIVEDDIKKLNELYDACWDKQKEIIDIKGFRPGEVPRSVAEKKLGVENLYKPVIDTLVNQGLSQIDLSFCQLDDVAVEWQTADKPLIIIVTGYLYPEVHSCDYKGLVVNYERLLVTDEEINTVLQRLAYSEAEEKELETFEGLSEEELKSVNVVVDFLMDDVQEERVVGNQTDYRVDITKDVFGFEQLLREKSPKVNEVLDTVITLPDDFFQQQLAGREIHYQLKVKRIYTLELPEINDELAKKVGYDNAKVMREELIRDLEESKKKADKLLYRDHIMGLLVAQTKASPIPDIMVRNELDQMLKGAVNNANRLQGTNLTPEDFLNSSRMSKEEWYSSNWSTAKQKLLGNLALEYIAKQERLHPTAEEKEQILREILPEGFEVESKDVNAAGLDRYAILKKAQDFLVDLIDKKRTKEVEVQNERPSSD